MWSFLRPQRTRRQNTEMNWRSLGALESERGRHILRREYRERIGVARPIREQPAMSAEMRAVTDRVKKMAVLLAKEGELPALNDAQRADMVADVARVMAEHPLFTQPAAIPSWWMPPAVDRIRALAAALV
jgi:hypothetical protein